MKQWLYVDNDYNKNKYECFPMKERVKYKNKHLYVHFYAD